MHCLQTFTATAALTLHLLATGLTTAQGTVLCVESDGQIQVETAQGSGCGPTAPTLVTGFDGLTASHCAACNDIPLQAGKIESVRPQLGPRTVAAGPGLVAVEPGLSGLPVIVASTRYPARHSVTKAGPTLRTTVLRI